LSEVGRLKSYEFRRERQRTWSELERLVQRVEKSGVRSLTPEQLARLPLLYRATLSSLSVARSISLDRALLDYLESLSARAYFAVYGTTRRLRHTLGGFFTHRFPVAVRRYSGAIAMAGAFLVLGVVVAWVLTARDPDWFYVFVSEGYSGGRNPAAPTAQLREGLYTHSSEGLTAFTSFLFTHNARIGMLAFAIGFVAGVPVFLLMFTTGLLLGAFSALYASRGLGIDFWGWLLPHGVTELLAVVLCGGAGLVLAKALVFPGRHSRLDNLALRGREAGTIVLGSVVLFFIAGLIEGYFRQLVTDLTVRWLVAALSAFFWVYYFVRVGRGRRTA